MIDKAAAARPRRISRRGREIAVIISAAEYNQPMAPRESLVEFFRNSPPLEAMAEREIDLERDRDAAGGVPL